VNYKIWSQQLQKIICNRKNWNQVAGGKIYCEVCMGGTCHENDGFYFE
jgi:cytochrome c